MRVQRVDPNLMCGKVTRCELTETTNRPTCGAVAGESLCRHHARRGRQVHDAARVTAVGHPPADHLGADPGALEVYVDHAVELGVKFVPEVPVAVKHTGVVDQSVDAPVLG